MTLIKAGWNVEGKPDPVGFKRGKEWKKTLWAASVDVVLRKKVFGIGGMRQEMFFGFDFVF